MQAIDPEGTSQMTIRERNYRKHPHTASFLRTFHDANGANYRTQPVTDEEGAALDYVSGHKTAGSTTASTARNDGSYVCEIQGHKVRCGGTFVTEKQAKWIIDIATTQVVPEGRTAESVLIRLEQGFAKFAGSQFITSYKDLPRLAVEGIPSVEATPEQFKAAAETIAEVPAGRYALRGEDGVVRFYKLDRPTEGKWAGWTFLKVQASDDLHPIRNKVEKARIITEIGKDILAAEQLYGRELGKCSRCGRTLTDETSRAYGIGPDCRNK